MKRIFVLLLAAILVISSLASCGSDTVDGEKEEKDTDEKVEEIEAEETEPEKAEDGFKPLETVYEDFKRLHLVPRIITADRFENAILRNIDDETDKQRLLSFYTKYDISEYIDSSFSIACEIAYVYPASRYTAIYVLYYDIVNKELSALEDIITKHCPEYTHGHMAADYLLCGYTQEEILSGDMIGRETATETAVPDFVKEEILVPVVMPAESFDNLLIAYFNSDETEVRDQLADSYILIEAGRELPAGEYYEDIIEAYGIVTLYDAYVLREDVSENTFELYNLQDIYVSYCNYDHLKLFQNMIVSGYFWFD